MNDVENLGKAIVVAIAVTALGILSDLLFRKNK